MTFVCGLTSLDSKQARQVLHKIKEHNMHLVMNTKIQCLDDMIVV